MAVSWLMPAEEAAVRARLRRLEVEVPPANVESFRVAIGVGHSPPYRRAARLLDDVTKIQAARRWLADAGPLI